MKMENVQSMQAVRARYQECDRGELIGQQIGLRATIHSLEWLLQHREDGATPELMLDSLRAQLIELHDVAHSRGVELVNYR